MKTKAAVTSKTTLSPERLRDYVNFFFKVRFGFLFSGLRIAAFLLFLISVAAFWTKEYIIMAIQILVAGVLMLSPLVIKSVHFSNFKKQLANNFKAKLDDEFFYSFYDDYYTCEVNKGGGSPVTFKIPYKNIISAYETTHSIYIYFHLEGDKKVILANMVGKNTFILGSHLGLREVLIPPLGKKYKIRMKRRHQTT